MRRNILLVLAAAATFVGTALALAAALANVDPLVNFGEATDPRPYLAAAAGLLAVTFYLVRRTALGGES